MALTRSEALTLQFYQWEQHCRGWGLYFEPIYPEPPFIPFYNHLSYKVQEDDGIHPTLLGKFINLFTTKKNTQEAIEQSIAQPHQFENIDEGYTCYVFALPKKDDVPLERIEELLLMLSYTKNPLSFEIVANHTGITLQVVCRISDKDHVYSQLSAYLPEVGIYEDEDAFYNIIKENNHYGFIDFGVGQETMRPIKTYQKNDVDPYTGIFGVLESLNQHQHATIQILFQGTQYPWAESIIRSVTTNSGDHFFVDAPEMLPLAQEKIASPLFGVAIRVVGQDKSLQESIQLTNIVANTILVSTLSPYNGLIALSSKDYEKNEAIDDVLNRQTRRSGMLLNSKELLTFLHIPNTAIKTEKLNRNNKASHAITIKHEVTHHEPLFLGNNTHKGNTLAVTIAQNHRLKHTHIIGATGTGKSTLLINLISQDLAQGVGICVIDPHGDLIEHILPLIPSERMNDVILFDPADREHPIGFNILSAHSDIEKEILSSDLVGIFKRLSTSWGDQMNSVLGNAILAFLESTETATLIDLRRFLIEKEFRNNFLKTVKDPNIRYYWQHEYPLLKSSSIGSILTRLDSFLRPKPIRNMVAQPKSLDFENILDTNKILLVKLSQGLIGNDNSYLLGSFIVTKIQQAAMARQAIRQEHRNNFFLYIDEFQNFITPSMSAILSGARKYNLGLVMVHQDMQQLSTTDSELASSVLSNAGTRVCFRLGDIDAKKLESGFTHFIAEDLQNLSTGEAIGRIESPNNDFNLSITPIPSQQEETTQKKVDRITFLSQSTYGTPKEEVEEIFRTLYQETNRGNQNTKAEPEPNKEQPTPQIEKQTATVPTEKEGTSKAKEETKEIDEKTAKKAIAHKSETQHRYLQTYIKRMAEARGYKAGIEIPTPDGKGRVDVLLEKNDSTIACEISVTTPSDWEVQNIIKCIKAGYSTVVSISTDKKALYKIQEKVEQEITNTKANILYFDTDGLINYLDSQAAKEATTEKRMKGYRVKVEYSALSKEETESKRQGLLRTIAKSIQKPK